jgi:hypothetical protein
MSSGRSDAIRSALSGAAAGAVGTAAMDLVLFTRYRRGGGTQKVLAWETAEGVDTWEKASGPGRVGQLMLRFLSGREPPDRWARPTTDLVHWMTGIGWGAQFGLLNNRSRRYQWEGALLLGPTAWLTSYIVLPLAKVYKPIWEYDAKTLAQDLSAHMVYGAVAAATFAGFTRSTRRPS